MVKVFYNGKDAFSGIAPTPFIGINDEFINYRDRFGATQNITLLGNITGNCKNFNFFIQQQEELFKNFQNDFKSLDIKEDSTTIFSAPYAKINSIDFSESVYVGAIPFTVNITAYPSGLFTGIYGITEPVNSIKYNEQQDGTVSITRNISAKGFNTNSLSNNALSNAISYVKSLTGEALIIPQFITNNTSILTPKQISETVNRLESSYSIDIEYIYRKNASASSILYYNIDINFDEEGGIYQVSLDGSLKGSIGYSIDSLRTDFNTLKSCFFTIAFKKFNQITNKTYLNSIPLSYNITEDSSQNSLSFSYQYSSDPYTTKFDKTFSLNYDYPRDLYTLGFNGTLTTLGAQNTRTDVLESALSKINVKALALDFFNKNVTGVANLNVNYKNYEQKRNKTSPEISLSAQFDNSPIPPDGFQTFKYNLSFIPSFYVHDPIQFLNGDNGAFKMNYYKRGSISIKGNATVRTSSNMSSTIRSQAIQILNIYAQKIGASNRLRVDDNVERNLYSTEEGYSYSFSITDTCETTIFSI